MDYEQFSKALNAKGEVCLAKHFTGLEGACRLLDYKKEYGRKFGEYVNEDGHVVLTVYK